MSLNYNYMLKKNVGFKLTEKKKKNASSQRLSNDTLLGRCLIDLRRVIDK